MTVFLGSPVLTTAAPIVSKDKGSLGNRINCAGSQAWNAIETGATVAGTVTVADYALKHKDKLSKAYKGTQNFAQKIANSKFGKKIWEIYLKVGQKVVDSKAFDKTNAIAEKITDSKFGKLMQKASQKIMAFGCKTADVLNKLPKGGKIGLLVALGLTILNGVYKSGQIDQKYTDRAEMEKHFV